MNILTAFRMLLRGVSPSAVREAELSLKEAGIEISQEKLVAHLLTTRDLNSLVAKLITTENRTEDWIERAFAEDLMIQLKLSAVRSDKIKRPLESAIALSGSVLIVALGFAATRILALREIDPWTVKIALGIFSGIIGVSFAYSYTASRIGKGRAEKLFSLLLGIGLVIVVWILTRIMP